MSDKAAYFLSILSEIDPEFSVLIRNRCLQDILSMPEYQILEKETTISGQLMKDFSESELKSLPEKELDARKQCIKEIPELIKMIKEAIASGNGPQLIGHKIPQWSDLKAIRSFAKEIVPKSGKGNYTNISPDNFMVIFDKSTVYSAKDLFPLLPKDTKNYQTEFDRLLHGQAFCISADEVDDLEKQYEDMVSFFKAKQADVGKSENMRRYVKAACGVALLFVPAFFGALTGALSFTSIALCTGAELLCVLLLWLWG